MNDVKKIYYPGAGGAFRIFIAHNNEKIFIPNFTTSFSELEKEFITKYASHLGFNNNIFPLDLQTRKSEICQCEWYNLSDEFLDFLKGVKLEIKDINNEKVTLKQISSAARATQKISKKTFFYKMVSKMSSDYLTTKWQISNNIKTLILSDNYSNFPIIIKSNNGKGGKGNLVCYNLQELNTVKNIFASELFAIKQETHNYDITSEIIVEKFFPNCSSYNLSCYCNISGQMLHARISEQIIEEVFYRGNIYPARLNDQEQKTILLIGKNICQYINKNLNYFGWIGLDFIRVDNKVCVIEANPRVNSVTHAHNLANGNPFIIRLMKYQTKNYKTVFRNFYFNHSTQTGVIPYQLPNMHELLIISIASSLTAAIKQLETFAQEQELAIVTQLKVHNYSKSISYYLSKN